MKGQILIADDETNLRQTIAERLTRAGYRVDVCADGVAALGASQRRQIDVAILDLNMPGISGLDLIERIRADQPACQVIVMTGYGTVETAVEAMKKGALDYLQKPLRLSELDIVVEKAMNLAHVTRTSERMGAAIERDVRADSMIGSGSALKDVRAWIDRASRTTQPVLIRGETGTGKELVARAIHQASPRARLPFVAVNCGALRDEILQNELFGHEKGAYTGADRRKEGLFEMASGGTLFLDEIGEMRLETQIALLRVIDSHSFRRLGGLQEIDVDLRIVSATHRDLKDMVRNNVFREDLYYRLAVIEIEVPPLRDRLDDIPSLVRHFAGRSMIDAATPLTITGEAYEILRAHKWPGNIRELRNSVERLLLLAGTEPVDAALVEGVLFGGSPLEQNLRQPPDSDFARKTVVELGGNKSAAARKLGISRPTLYRLLDFNSPPAKAT